MLDVSQMTDNITTNDTNSTEDAPVRLSKAMLARAAECRALSRHVDRAFDRLSVSVIELGHKLTLAKKAARHGDWLPFLEAAGIHERAAQRAMAAYREKQLSPEDVAELNERRAAKAKARKAKASPKARAASAGGASPSVSGPSGDAARIEDLERRLAEANAELARRVLWTSAQRKLLRKAMHPDANPTDETRRKAWDLLEAGLEAIPEAPAGYRAPSSTPSTDATGMAAG